VNTTDWLAAEFQANRAHLRAVSYRMLGSLAEADDAVQETWLRLTSADTADVRNLRAWLTTVVSRVCLDMLRARTARRENPLDVHVPDPVVAPASDDPEQHALLADSVGLALLVVLDTLSPSERLAFVLHDVFAVPFEQIGPVLDRSPAAAKQLASRARRRLRGAEAPAASDVARQRELAEAFLAAAGGDNFDRLLAVLDPDVVLRADTGTGSPFGPSKLIRGAREVAAEASQFTSLARLAQLVLVNGTPGYLVARNGQPLAVIGLAVRDGKVSEIDILADPERLSQLDLTGLIP
jgi:RNA polymerase sigma factor (sigma-70 family)